ncbi:flavin reductase family protein [Tsukamurella soli]
MIAAAQAIGAEWELHYVGRSRASMGFLDELAPHAEQVTLIPRDERDRLDLDALLARPRTDTAVYCCGPERLLTAVEAGCRDRDGTTAHVERFSAKVTDEPAPDTAFEVDCQRSGVTVTVPAGTSIYSAVEAAGVDVLGSCMEGVCGTCECDVLEGVADHRDSVLSESERESGETIMICVSRARSERLVLDL